MTLDFHRNKVYGHFEQVRKNQESELKVKVGHMFYKVVLSALICHFYAKSMIAHAALVLNNTLATRFASI